jgi:hypothetical protein
VQNENASLKKPSLSAVRQAGVAIESFLNMKSDGLKAELQQCPTHPKPWRDAVLGVRQTPCIFSED